MTLPKQRNTISWHVAYRETLDKNGSWLGLKESALHSLSGLLSFSFMFFIFALHFYLPNLILRKGRGEGARHLTPPLVRPLVGL